MAELGDLFVPVARPTLRAHQFDVPFPFGLVVPEFLYLFFKFFDSLVESPHILLGMAGLRRRAWFFARNEKYSSGFINSSAKDGVKTTFSCDPAPKSDVVHAESFRSRRLISSILFKYFGKKFLNVVFYSHTICSIQKISFCQFAFG